MIASELNARYKELYAKLKEEGKLTNGYQIDSNNKKITKDEFIEIFSLYEILRRNRPVEKDDIIAKGDLEWGHSFAERVYNESARGYDELEKEKSISE